MNGFADHPERVLLSDRAGRPDRSAVVAGVSLALHGLLIVLVLIAEFVRAPQREKDEPALSIAFVDAFQPPPPPPPRPRPEVPIEQPKVARAAPAPPEDERSLLGWNSSGAVQGTPERPPGPETGKHGPEPPGPDGKGRPEGEAARAAEAPAPDLAPLAPAAAEPEPEPEPAPDMARPSEGGPALGDPLPLPRGDDLPRRADARERPPSSTYRGRPSTGRGSARGSGIDFDVGGGGAFGDLSFESTDYDWSEYSSKVYWAVYRSWLRELYGRTTRFERDQALRRLDDLDAEVTIRVVLRRAGPIETQVVVASVVPTLDEASEAALHRAVLPPLPPDFPRDTERVLWRFRIEGFESAQQLHRHLEYAQYRNEF